MASKVLAVVLCLVAAPAFAQGDLKIAPVHLSLQIVSDKPGERCARSDASGPAQLVVVSLHRTFHDDFDQHPLLNGGWVPHYAGAGSLPESFYAGGEGSVLGRKTKYNGEQQIYVDPGYEGRGMVPLGLNPFKVRDGVLSIVASRIPSDLKEMLFSNEYVSGVLTTQKSFSQKYGYFEIRAKIPLGTGVWPAFWLLANDGGWPPEIDGGTRTTARRRRDDDALENSGHRFRRILRV